MTGDESIVGQAAAWHIASEGDDMDWAGFTAWLEADPRHRTAYDDVALSDAMLTRHAEQVFASLPAPANDQPDQPSTGRWLRWGGGALAAGLALMLAIPAINAPGDTVYATAAQGRTIALADGSSVALAPRSRLTLADGSMDRMALEGGALFDIRHQPGRTLQIDAGGVTISDIGTRFDVQSATGSVRVAVAEGTVNVGGATFASPVRLNAGKALMWDRAAHSVHVGAVATGNVGTWRQGRLTYDNAPLALVAEDLSRYAGIAIIVAQPDRDRPFSGTLALGHGDTAVRDLSQLMGLSLRRDGDGYRIGSDAR